MEGRYSTGGDDGSRNRITLLDAIEKSRDRRTLETILSMEKQPGQANRTLLDIIRDEESGSLFGHKDKKSWKAFRDKLRLKRAGSAWTSSVHTPTSDIPIPVENRFRNSNINNASSRSSLSQLTLVTRTGTFTWWTMARLLGDLRPQISRHNSTRFPVVDPTQSDENDFDPSALEGTTRLGTALAEERLLSAREAVAAQEAAEAAAQAEAAAAAASEQETEEGAMPMPGNMETQEPVRMSLMDLLEETDRQMGFEGSRYTMGDLEACDDDDDDDEEGRGDGGDGGAVIECCVQESFGFKGVIALYAMVSSWKFLIYFEDSRHFHVNFFAPVLLSLKWEVRNTIDWSSLMVRQKIGKRVAGSFGILPS
ncbi:hypothetical protein OIU74_011742 [Salix koriyanagi]|uniref:Uncharacterized protein n=1 Tax=Salix koriyanagi TaxID=2511006 RepID=A0A9Q0TFZ2_9ROSI|nr:hypothetical protein OIU74_011742 [Salix koriyanagi]